MEIQIKRIATLNDFIKVGIGIGSCLLKVQKLDLFKYMESVNSEFHMPENEVVTLNNIMSWIVAYTDALDDIENIENLYNDDPNYFHNNINKLLSSCADLKDKYIVAMNFLDKQNINPKLKTLANKSKSLVNSYLQDVRNLLELDIDFINLNKRLGIDYVKKYKLEDV